MVERVGLARRERDELHVGAVREALVVLEPGAVLGDARGGRIVDEQDQVRVADAGRVAAVGRAVEGGFEIERARRVERDLERDRR